MFDTLCKWEELERFIERLKEYETAYNYSMNYIEKLNGNCWLILNLYKKKLRKKDNTSIIIPGIRESMNDLVFSKKNIKIKKLIKAFIPYGLIQLKRKFSNNIQE